MCQPHQNHCKHEHRLLLTAELMSMVQMPSTALWCMSLAASAGLGLQTDEGAEAEAEAGHATSLLLCKPDVQVASRCSLCRLECSSKQSHAWSPNPCRACQPLQPGACQMRLHAACYLLCAACCMSHAVSCHNRPHLLHHLQDEAQEHAAGCGQHWGVQQALQPGLGRGWVR